MKYLLNLLLKFLHVWYLFLVFLRATTAKLFSTFIMFVKDVEEILVTSLEDIFIGECIYWGCPSYLAREVFGASMEGSNVVIVLLKSLTWVTEAYNVECSMSFFLKSSCPFQFICVFYRLFSGALIQTKIFQLHPHRYQISFNSGKIHLKCS